MCFGLQGVVSTAGALEVVFPDIPAPVSFAAGRAFHLNISVFWPLAGLIGGIYYFYEKEAGRTLYSSTLAKLHFWIFVCTVLSLLGSLILGFTEGREYLEALWPFRVAVAVSLILLTYNLLRTAFASPVALSRATVLSMLTGCLTLIIFYIPTIFTYAHPSLDEIAKFLVVHLWEEMCLELIGIGVTAALLLDLTGIDREKIEKIIYLDIGLIALAGIFATGHHYYWVGAPAIWIWIGGIFSAIQVMPTALLFLTMFKSVSYNIYIKLGAREKLTLFLILCSMLYHVFGAGLLGFFMAYPSMNKYVHGTYVTSAHSHLAVFGVFGFLVLAVCVYILFTEVKFSRKYFYLFLFAAIAINAGLLIMSLSLLLAGGLQTYFFRVLGMSVAQTNQLIRPYLLMRMAGGFVYFTGSSLLAYCFIKSLWPHRDLFLKEAECITGEQRKRLRLIKGQLHLLIRKQKEIGSLLVKMTRIYQLLGVLKNLNKMRNKR
jgi:nitric oxide reductase subunit B